MCTGQTRGHAARADEREDPVRRRAHERDDAERDVERESDQPGEDEQQQHEPEDDDRAAQAVRSNLLLKSHGVVPNETCGGDVSPRAEKNSRAWKPSGVATSSQGKLWIPVLNRITVEL